jgi:hypothetical protein
MFLIYLDKTAPLSGLFLFVEVKQMQGLFSLYVKRRFLTVCPFNVFLKQLYLLKFCQSILTYYHCKLKLKPRRK